MRALRVLVTGAVVVSTTLASARADSVTLRYRWPKGDTLHYRIVLKTDSTMTGLDSVGDVSMKQTIAEAVRMEVVDVAPDGSVMLRQTIDSARMEMNSPLGSFVYDSASPSASTDAMTATLARFIGAMVGEPLTLEMAPNGTIRRVEGVSRMLEKATAGSQDPGAAAMTQGLRSILNDESMRSVLEQTFSTFPNHPVSVGDTWTGQFTLTNPMAKMTANPVFTLKALEGDGNAGVARIGVTVSLKTEMTPPPVASGLTMTMGDATADGEIVFETGKGRIRTSTMHTAIPSTMSMSGPNGPMTVRNVMNMTMTFELVDK